MHKILITGITGFLGSHIAERLIHAGMKVIGLKRPESDIWRCDEFKNDIDWVDINEGYEDRLISHRPDMIIHCAWIGVEAKDRDNWTEQVKNITFLVNLLEIAKKSQSSKIICLGSQAEYGKLNGIISEDIQTVAMDAYAGVKLAAIEIIKSFSGTCNLDWVWFRVFSVLGEKENRNWLIPSVVTKMQNDLEMDFTKGEQKYAYMYIKDFTEIIFRTLKHDIKSGIYNISGKHAKPLRSIIESIRDIVNPNFKLNFGAVDYRINQSMHIEGNISKLTSEIGEIEFTNFSVALNNVISYYNNKKVL